MSVVESLSRQMEPTTSSEEWGNGSPLKRDGGMGPGVQGVVRNGSVVLPVEVIRD